VEVIPLAHLLELAGKRLQVGIPLAQLFQDFPVCLVCLFPELLDQPIVRVG
jgi:hypothetical protein